MEQSKPIEELTPEQQKIMVNYKKILNEKNQNKEDNKND